MPAHQMKVGDEAEVFDSLLHSKASSSSSSKKSHSSSSGNNKDSSTVNEQHICGVVSKVTPTTIEFVCDDSQGDEGSSGWLLASSSLRMNLRSSEATHKKLTAALGGLRGVAGEWEEGVGGARGGRRQSACGLLEVVALHDVLVAIWRWSVLHVK